MEDSSSVRRVHFRRHYQNLPKQKQQNRKRDREEKEQRDEKAEEDKRQRPPNPDGSSTIDLTA